MGDMGAGMGGWALGMGGGLWMVLIAILAVLAIVALVKYLAK